MLNAVDLGRVDLNLLVLFDVVLSEGHVGRTAERMHLTASAVSHGLGRLRTLLNDPLFLKTPKGVVPTARALKLAEPQRAWRGAFAELESRAMDIAVMPIDDIPARFHRQTLYEEDFVLAMRRHHPLAKKPTMDGYCEAAHLVVSLEGDARGFVDEVLAGRGRSRRIALTVPNFMFALSMLGGTDLVAALPRRFAALYAARFGLVVVDAPVPLGRFRLEAITPEVALMDKGLAWCFGLLLKTQAKAHKR